MVGAPIPPTVIVQGTKRSPPPPPPGAGRKLGLQMHRWHIKRRQLAHRSEAQACQDWAWFKQGLSRLGLVQAMQSTQTQRIWTRCRAGLACAGQSRLGLKQCAAETCRPVTTGLSRATQKRADRQYWAWAAQCPGVQSCQDLARSTAMQDMLAYQDWA